MGHDIIVIGASAGGVEGLQRLVRDLPEDLAAAIFVVVHVAASSPGLLGDILNRAGPLYAAKVVDGEPIQFNRIYVARPDHHMLLDDRNVRVMQGPRENRCRPAIDPLFRSASHTFGGRVIGILLSGYLDDGTAGLMAIKRGGGKVIVQNPRDTPFPDMPQNALGHAASFGGTGRAAARYGRL